MRDRFRAARVIARVACLCALVGHAASVGAADAVLYRIFLRDGSSLVSYGDYARVADRVVFSMPVAGLDTDSPVLHIVTIAESSVDWLRTVKYGEAARAKHYADTRGEADFEQLSTEVANALNAVATTRDPAKRLAQAESARRTLADWPSRHFGYRAADVAQLSLLLDGVISELRVAAGQSQFELNLVAHMAPVPTAEILPPPTLRESIEAALMVAQVTPEPAERISLLRTIVQTLDPAASDAWMAATHARAATDLAAEEGIEKAYQEFLSRTLATAEQRTKRADIAGIERLIRSVQAEDDRLGRKRPQTTASILNTLDAKLEVARHLRLERDAWAMRRPKLREYQRRINPALDQLQRSAEGLEEIKRLAGPSPRALSRLADRLADASVELKLVKPPSEAVTVHELLMSAVQMATLAAAARKTAITTTDMKTAWDASAAAAGALMLVERARGDLQKLNTQPGQ
jgi:hypothetical protein